MTKSKILHANVMNDLYKALPKNIDMTIQKEWLKEFLNLAKEKSISQKNTGFSMEYTFSDESKFLISMIQ